MTPLLALALAASPCDTATSKFDALGDGPVSTTMPAAFELLSVCPQKLSKNERTIISAYESSLRDVPPGVTGVQVDISAAAHLNESKLSPWSQLCAAASPVIALNALKDDLATSQKHRAQLFTQCRFESLNLLTSDEFVSATQAPLFALWVGKRLLAEGFPLERVQHLARVLAAPKDLDADCLPVVGAPCKHPPPPPPAPAAKKR